MDKLNEINKNEMVGIADKVDKSLNVSSNYGDENNMKNNNINNIDEENLDEENLELSDNQSKRVDEVYESVMELCKVMCEDPELDWDMQYIGEIADVAAHILTCCGKKVRFPSVVTNEDGSQYIEEYYEG